VSADLDALDRGVVDVGLVAAEALVRVEALEAKADKLAQVLIALSEAAGQPGVVDQETASFADPASARAQARRRRIEASGLRVVKEP
jgi:hypothetical protein